MKLVFLQLSWLYNVVEDIRTSFLTSTFYDFDGVLLSNYKQPISAIERSMSVMLVLLHSSLYDQPYSFPIFYFYFLRHMNMQREEGVRNRVEGRHET
jgi:hypothetical protein